MEPLLKALKELPARFKSLPSGARAGILGGLTLAVLIGIGTSILSSGTSYQYAFTNLTPEDSTEAGSALKAANIPFRTEANGSALAVPATQVHEARLLLAAAGLPRGGGVGFELFDRGDLGASEFTQRVNLRRATEGELARTIGRLAAVRSARVHLTLPERGLFRDEDRKPSAAVVLNLQPGRVMQERELAGVRHLVASSVAGLDPNTVSILDGRGTVLSGDRSESARLSSQQHEVESALEQRIVQLLEPAVGAGAVVAKVTATLDTSEVETTSDSYDGDNQVVRSERKTTETTGSEGAGASSGVAGAAANVPLGAATGGGTSGGNRAQSTHEDDTKNYEISKKVTHTVTRAPRITKLSAAVLIDGVDGKPRADAEIRRLSDLAKSAMGYDVQRGDAFDISSAPFAKSSEQGSGPTPIWARPEIQSIGKTAGVLLAAGAFVIFLFMRFGKITAGSGSGSNAAGMALLKPGSSVAELEAMLTRRGLGPVGSASAADGSAALRDRARELSKADPARAAHLLRAWIASDSESKERARV
jgi:flagellar M-ring protein FliF